MLGKIMLLVHLLTDLRLLAGPDAPVVDGVAVAGEEDQDGEGNDAHHSPLELCNNHKVSSHLTASHPVTLCLPLLSSLSMMVSKQLCWTITSWMLWSPHTMYFPL